MYLTEQINKIIFMRVYYGVFNNCSVHSIEGLIYTFIHRSVWIHLRVSFRKRNSDFGRFFSVIISVQNFWINLSLKKNKKKNWIHFWWKKIPGVWIVILFISTGSDGSALSSSKDLDFLLFLFLLKYKESHKLNHNYCLIEILTTTDLRVTISNERFTEIIHLIYS